MATQRFVSVFVTIAICLTVSTPAWAELSAYMRIRGERQGVIKGGVTQKGREDSIMVVAVDHKVATPLDPATAAVRGAAQHQPFVITKLVDVSSPLLHQAQASGENLKEVTIDFFQPARTGAETLYYKVTLKNARIASIRHVMLDNQDPSLARRAAYEEVGFAYQEITWTWTQSNVTATDSPSGRAKR